MIDITAGEARVTQIRYTMLKEFDIDVTIGEETHNLELTIKSEEDKQGEDTELVEIRIATQTFRVSNGTGDVAEELHDALDNWFSIFKVLAVKDTETEFDLIFAAVWEYIEKKNLN